MTIWRRYVKRPRAKNGIKRKLADGTIKEYDRSPNQIPLDRTVRYAIAKWQESSQWDNYAENTRKTHRYYVDVLHENLGDKALTSITPENLEALKEDVRNRARFRLHLKRGQTGGDGAAIVFSRAIGAFFKWCVDTHKLKESPVKNLTGGLKIGSHPTWEEADYKYAVENLPDHLARAVIVAAHTGLRRSDLIKLKWSQITARGIECLGKAQTQKTKVGLVIKISPEFSQMLKSWRLRARSEFILEGRLGKPISGPTLSATLSDALVKLGLPDDINIHGLRKLCCKRLAEAGCSVYEIMAITGHKNARSVQCYVDAANQVVLASGALAKLISHQKSENDQISL